MTFWRISPHIEDCCRRLALLLVALTIPDPALAQRSFEASLPLEATLAPDGRALDLSWAEATPPRVGSAIIKRRRLGDSGGESWRVISPDLGPVMRFSDTTILPGVGYEYQVLRTARDIVDVGYWATGTELPAEETRGTALLVVDETIADALSARLDRFVLDLVGDGWSVERFAVTRGESRSPVQNLAQGRALRQWVQEQYFRDPFGRHALILIGHVPVVQSGRVAPDGHETTPHPTDLFYADVDGSWPDNGEGILLPNQVPGDFIEMQVGRIDFSSISGGDRAREVRLLAAYFDKNHHWRHGLLGDLRAAYAGSEHLITERYGLRNIVGPGAVEAGGHEGVGERQPWLWGIDFGSWDGARYADLANKAVFTLNFGSGKQKFDSRGNTMTALLARPWYPIATGWGGRPAWWLHPMALGASFGDVHMRTVNNGSSRAPYRESMDYYPTGNYLWRNPIWVNLLGDPTARPFPLAPATRLTVRSITDGVLLKWQPSPDDGVLGYRVFRAERDSLVFRPIDGGALEEATEFLDTDPVEGGWYMVRAYGLKDVYAGSFYTYAQGVFGEIDQVPLAVSTRTVRTAVDVPIVVTPYPDSSSSEEISAFITGPEQGELTPVDEGWLYTPPLGFSGRVRLPISASNGFSRDIGYLEVIVGD